MAHPNTWVIPTQAINLGTVVYGKPKTTYLTYHSSGYCVQSQKEKLKRVIQDAMRQNMLSGIDFAPRTASSVIRLVWFIEIESDVILAEEKFDKLLDDGYRAYVSIRKKKIRIYKFDKKLEEIELIKPRKAGHRKRLNYHINLVDAFEEQKSLDNSGLRNHNLEEI